MVFDEFTNFVDKDAYDKNVAVRYEPDLPSGIVEWINNISDKTLDYQENPGTKTYIKSNK